MLTSSTCGDSRASSDAPNGAEDWLNCGLTSGGWSPPHLGLDQLVTQTLHADGVFAPCAPYFWAFEQYGNANGSKSLSRLSRCPVLTTSSPHPSRLFRYAGINL